MATKPRGGGLKALVAGPLRKELFFAASQNIHKFEFKSSLYQMFLKSTVYEIASQVKQPLKGMV